MRATSILSLSVLIVPLAASAASAASAAGQSFGPPQVLTTDAMWAMSVYATDLDEDGDVDVLCCSNADDKVTWFENLGGGAFGPEQVISTEVDGAWCVYAADLDGDGGAEVLSASAVDNKAAWYENLMDPCLPTNYCAAQMNSSGGPAEIGFLGTTSLGARDLVLTVQGAPS